MNKKRVSVFFGAFVLVVLMVVLVSALGVGSWSLDMAVDVQGVLTGWEELIVKGDLESAGYDLYSREYSFEEILDIIDLMESNQEAYESDWSYINTEMNCYYDFYLNREPGEIFQMQGGNIISYCLPSGEPPWVAHPNPFSERSMEDGDGPGGSDGNWETNEDGSSCTAVKQTWGTAKKKNNQCSLTCKDNQAQCNQCCVNSFGGSGQSWDRNQCLSKCAEVWAE